MFHSCNLLKIISLYHNMPFNYQTLSQHSISFWGVKGAVCGPRGTHLAGRCVPVKIWEMPFIPAKSDACMSSP